jgi:hypothetical protein
MLPFAIAWLALALGIGPVMVLKAGQVVTSTPP